MVSANDGAVQVYDLPDTVQAANDGRVIQDVIPGAPVLMRAVQHGHSLLHVLASGLLGFVVMSSFDLTVRLGSSCSWRPSSSSLPSV